MNDDLISRSEMCKALGIELYGPDILLDKKIIETQLANKVYNPRTDIIWEIRVDEQCYQEMQKGTDDNDEKH